MLVSNMLIIILSGVIVAAKLKYISTERPKVVYYNSKYVKYINFTSQRYSRRDPFYYVGIHMNVIYQFDNNITIDVIFYEFLSNRYKRSFVEMHFKACDLIHKDLFFGQAMRQGKLKQPCPFPPGDYHMYNMTIPLKQVPDNFPFMKGRIYGNITSTTTRELIAAGHIDMELKELNTPIRKK